MGLEKQLHFSGCNRNGDMTPWWVEAKAGMRVAIVPRPRGGDWLEDELRGYKDAGMDVLVSMLAAEEAAELGLAAEAETCGTVGIRFVSFPIVDRETPESLGRFRELIEALRGELNAGRSVATHCRASIGRATLVLACLLCAEGLSADEAFRRLSAARGAVVPDTLEQREWVERFADGLK